MRPIHAITIATLSFTGPKGLAAEFLDQVKEVSMSGAFRTASAKASEMLNDDKLDDANKALIGAFPESNPSAAQCFVLGNSFFSMADDLALRYHKLALDTLPDEPHINLEYAMDLHRAGKATEAIPHYEKYIAAEPRHYLAHALLADCLIRVGRYKDAVDHWKQAHHSQNHTGIDFAIHSIYGAPSPHRRRNDLKKDIEGGQLEKLVDLLALSVAWDRDWWNIDFKADLLERDLKLAEAKLGKDAPKLTELRLYARTYTEKVDPTWLKDALTANGWILGENATLPAQGKVADRLVALVLEQSLDTAPNLLKRFEKELQRRALGTDGNDVMALNMLAHLLASNGASRAADLEDVDLAGWERYHDERFAASYLSGLFGAKKLSLDSAQFIKASSDFPDSSFIASLGMKMAKEGSKNLTKPLVAAIKAEYHQLSLGIGGFKDSYILKALFALLEEQL